MLSEIISGSRGYRCIHFQSASASKWALNCRIDILVAQPSGSIIQGKNSGTFLLALHHTVQHFKVDITSKPENKEYETVATTNYVGA